MDFSWMNSINTAPESVAKKEKNKIKPNHAYQLYITDAHKAGPSSKGLYGIKFIADITDFEGKKYGKIWQTVYFNPDPESNYIGNTVFAGMLNAFGIPADALADLDTFAQLLNHGECIAVLNTRKDDNGNEWAQLNMFTPGVIGNINEMDKYNEVYNETKTPKMEDIPMDAADEVDFFN